jgi:hypothetical protein
MESNMTDTLKIEAGKECLLRNGWRMICYRISDDETAYYPIRGVMIAGNDYMLESWTAEGLNDRDVKDGQYDIISPAPETVELDCWVMVWADGRTDTGLRPLGGAELVGGFAPVAQFRLQRSVTVGEGM